MNKEEKKMFEKDSASLVMHNAVYRRLKLFTNRAMKRARKKVKTKTYIVDGSIAEFNVEYDFCISVDAFRKDEAFGKALDKVIVDADEFVEKEYGKVSVVLSWRPFKVLIDRKNAIYQMTLIEYFNMPKRRKKKN